MKPYGIHSVGAFETEPRILSARAYEKRIGKAEIAAQLEDALHPAEERLIDCDVGMCEACGGPCTGLG